MAPSIAMVNAGDISSRRASSVIRREIAKPGRPTGMPPNFEPTVATGQPSAAASAVVTMTATMLGGTAFTMRGSPWRMATVIARIAIALPVDLRHVRRHPTLNCCGTCSGIFNPRPSPSLSCAVKMMIAIPVVKPATTGYGMNFNNPPQPQQAHEEQHHARHHRGQRENPCSRARPRSPRAPARKRPSARRSGSATRRGPR